MDANVDPATMDAAVELARLAIDGSDNALDAVEFILDRDEDKELKIVAIATVGRILNTPDPVHKLMDDIKKSVSGYPVDIGMSALTNVLGQIGTSSGTADESMKKALDMTIEFYKSNPKCSSVTIGTMEMPKN